MKKTKLSMEMFTSVNQFTGIDRQNLIVEGELDIYVPYVIKLLWFRSVYPKGMIKTSMTVSMDEIARNRLCVFVAEVFDGNGNLLAMGHGSATADEENFVEVSERRAAGKALAAAGFTWHNGDFSNEADVAKTQLSIYNKYIESGSFDVYDETVKMLYDDALVSILPDGYSAAGKPIAALDSLQLANIAKSYGVSNDGDPIVNAKIKFVYQYKLLESESQKQPEAEAETSKKDTDEKPEKQPRKRAGRKSKKTVVAEDSETSDMTDNNPAEEVAVENSTELSENKMADKQMALPRNAEMPEPTEVEGAAVDMPVQAEVPEEVYSDEVLESSGDEEELYDGYEGFHVTDDGDASPFETFADEELQESFELPEDEFYGREIEMELHKEEVLKEWGYANEEALCADWKTHLTLVREKCSAVDWKDESVAKAFVEEIPIYDNFLWSEKCDKNMVVLLGDFLNAHKDEVMEVVNEGHFPLPTLRYPVNWYITNVWGMF